MKYCKDEIMHKWLHKNSGFTLVELMIVMSIIGILSSIAVPKFMGSLNRSRLTEASLDIFGTIQQSRTLAAKMNRNIVVAFDIGLGTYTAFVNDDGTDTTDSDNDSIPDGAENWTVDLTEKVVARGEMPKNIILNSANFNGNPFFMFDNKGLPYDNTGALTSGSVQVSNVTGSQRTISLLMSGHSRIQ